MTLLDGTGLSSATRLESVVGRPRQRWRRDVIRRRYRHLILRHAPSKPRSLMLHDVSIEVARQRSFAFCRDAEAG